MATLRNVQGSSLVPDLSGGLNVLFQAFGTPETRAKQADEAKLRGLRVEGIENAVGDLGSGNKLSTQRMQRLALVAPEVAKAIEAVTVSGDARQAAEIQRLALNGARVAKVIDSKKGFQNKRREIMRLFNEAQAKGEPTQKFVDLMSARTEDELNSKTLKLGLGAADAAALTKDILRDRFEDITDAQGRPLAQRNVATGRVEEDPRAPNAGGLFSAKTDILEDGTTILVGPNGRSTVRNPAGAIVEGEERLAALAKAQEAALEKARAKAASTASGKLGITMASNALESLASVRQGIELYDEALGLVQEGAGTGPIESLFPSFKATSVALDNVQSRLGLNVIANGSFGALSAPELKFALGSGLPTGLDGEDLKAWILRKQNAQRRLGSYLERAASFLSDPNNTVSDWLRINRETQKEIEASRKPKEAPPAGTIITNSAGQRGRVEADGSVTVLP